MTTPSNRPGRLGVGVIGAGRVGAVLGAALRAAGHAVVGVSAVSDASRERAELLLPEVPVLTVPEVVERAELVLLAVPDDQLPDLVGGLAEAGHWQAGQLVVHVAGRWGTSVLEPARGSGVIPLAIHPAMTFTGMSMDLDRLADCSFGVTAPAAVLPIAQALVVEMGGEPVVIPEADRTLYHAGLTHGANHLTTVVGQAIQVLGGIGVEQPSRVLGALTRASLDNALTAGETALTGPVSRGDAGTVREHRLALAEEALATGQDDVLRAYADLARVTADRALARGRLDPAAYQAVIEALGPAPQHLPEAPRVPARQDGPVIVTDPAEFRALLRNRSAEAGPGATVGLVPTMGALHDGHGHMVRQAREENDVLAVSVFVNPLQFGPHEDFSRYPADLEADVARLAGLGADIVFAPSVEQMYPGGLPLVRVSSGELGTRLEGGSRPGHFDGVLTVVAKLFALAGGTGRPLRAYFGQKDAQQLLIVDRMVRDLNLDVEVRPVPIVRAPDGLALSSRNAYLGDDERTAALVLPRTLQRLATREITVDQARREIAAQPIGVGSRTVELDYLVVVDPATLEEAAPAPGALALVAAHVGDTRLIDNLRL
ncbi:pantoate--beta-alanine ligase [Kocuria coralli]|uniref:Pantothenate synthetase n=1 Tax=Kocuria coralli TaxID=1461025 RepID=A0A5J5KWX1_9MICC|nr:pantoate--beta-alanine ligase [Kocuria coralli]